MNGPVSQRREKMLKNNRLVDLKLVQNFERLEKELIKMGIKVGPHYSLVPPLGNSPACFVSSVQEPE